MDRLDLYLAKNPIEEPPDDFPGIVRLHFRRRQRKFRMIRAGLSLSLVCLGIIFIIPGISNLTSHILIPTSGLPILENISKEFLPLEDLLNQSWQGMNGLSYTMQSSLGLTSSLGLIAIGLGSLIGLNSFFPRLKT
jgi:hypothetical protein